MWAHLNKICSAIAVLLLTTAGHGATINTTFPVSATVLGTCSTVSATALSFGNYNPLDGLNSDATNTINVTCTIGSTYSISLNGGTTSGGTVAQRLLSDGNNHTLEYNLYTSILRTTIWGDGTNGTSTVNGVGIGIALGSTVYGRIPASQNVDTGSYSDTITVTVTY